MPPKGKRVLKTANLTQKEENTAVKEVKQKKVKIEKENEDDELSESKNWHDVLARALTVKQNKTLIKSLASNADEAIEQLSENELRRAVFTAQFIAIPEGQKFCARALPKLGIKSAFILMKKAVIDDKQTWTNYGELIAAAWKHYHREDEVICKEIEDEIIKGLFHDAIMVNFPLSTKFMEMLSAFQNVTVSFKAKMDDMLYQSSRVVLWRGCQAINNRVRYRACKILLKFFPWRPADANDLEEATNKQYDFLGKMLVDSCVEIRREATCKIMKILAQFWTYIPSYKKREYLTQICDELVKDADPSVRCAILEGLGFMVMEAICQNAAEAALKCVCPLTIVDRNDNVRYQTVKLLYKLIPNRFIKYWDIVPMETLMKCLELETSESVRIEMVRLVFKSFCQKEDDYRDMLKRLNYLCKFGRNAALTFYKLIVPEKLISIEDAGAHLKNIALAVYKIATGNYSDDSKIFDETVGSLSGPIGEMTLDEKHPKWNRAKLFMDCAVVLYATLLRDPSFNAAGSENKRDVKGGLANLMTKVFQKMFQCFRETSALGTTMLLGSLLPQDTMSGLIHSVLQHLNEETDKEVVKPYLEAVTQWKADVVLDMIREGMKALQRNPISSPLIKRNKSAKTFSPAEQLSKSLYYLAYILSSLATKEVLIRNHLFEIDELYKNLCSVKDIIDQRLLGAVHPDFDDDLLLEAYVMKQTLVCVLLNTPRKTERDAEDALFYVKYMCEEVTWFKTKLDEMNEFLADENKREFFFRLGNVFLRKLCDILMVYDFTSVPSISKAPSFLKPADPNQSNLSEMEQTEINFIESFKRICFAFLNDETPSEFMPSIFNVARQLVLLNPDQTDLAVQAVIYAPTWIITRAENSDELKDKQIGEQLFLLMKVVLDCPKFRLTTYMHQLAQALIDVLQWIIVDSGNCPDPREHDYVIPRQVEILLVESVKRNSTLFRTFCTQFGSRCFARDLLQMIQEYNINRQKEQVFMETLGACAQLAHIIELEHDGAPKRPQSDIVQCNKDVEQCLHEIRRRVEKLEQKSDGKIDNFLIAQVKAMLNTDD